MSDEPETQKGGWTYESLLRYVTSEIHSLQRLMEASDRRYEQRFKDSQTAVDAALNAARTAVDAALSAAKEAVHKAEMASEKRFEGVNEFRATLADQQRTLMPRTEAEIRMIAIEKQIADLKESQTERKGQRRGMDYLWGYIVGALGALAILWKLLGGP